MNKFVLVNNLDGPTTIFNQTAVEQERILSRLALMFIDYDKDVLQVGFGRKYYKEIPFALEQHCPDWFD